jgi:hypothetical protein
MKAVEFATSQEKLERGKKEPVHIASEGEDLVTDQAGAFLCSQAAEDPRLLSQTA